MNCKIVTEQIVDWLKRKMVMAKVNGFVVGISGGIDSAVVSALCMKTGLPVCLVSLPIHQPKSHLYRASDHIDWILDGINGFNCWSLTLDLTTAFEVFVMSFGDSLIADLAQVNLRSRLRTSALYALANTHNYLVAGTGNKIEDYGIGFFTKYGDGGVDLSPIGDLTKTEVRELARYLGINQEIIDAAPTDGLWEDDRSDEEQIGATYEELEWAMDHLYYDRSGDNLTDRQKQVLAIYRQRHNASQHKMTMPPICVVNKE